MRERLRKFLQGRNGYDALSRCLIWASVVLLLLALFTSRALNGAVSSAFWLLALAAVAFSYFRVFSRNVYRRQAENAKYQRLVGKLRAHWTGFKARWHDRKTHKYYRCPACKANLRVPRNKGKIRITCKKCGCQFERTT